MQHTFKHQGLPNICIWPLCKTYVIFQERIMQCCENLAVRCYSIDSDVLLLTQTGQMVKVAAQHPAKALMYINKALNELACLTKDPAVQAFDMEIDDSCIEVAFLHCCVQPIKISLTMIALLIFPHALYLSMLCYRTTLLLPWVRPAPCMTPKTLTLDFSPSSSHLFKMAG